MKKILDSMLKVSMKSLAWAFFGVVQMIFSIEINHPAGFILLFTGWASIVWAIAREKNLD